MSTAPQSPATEQEKSEQKLSLLQVAGSILASFYGVQSSRNRERDFKSGKAGTFIAVGVALTAVWYLSIYGVVQLVLHASGR